MDLLQDGIAIIGISCKFPGAKNKDEYWNNLIEQKETIKRFTDEELKDHEYNWESLKDDPNYIKARGTLEDIDKWDANFFNIIPKDAKIMDPQQRLWLENTWHAFEDAGYNPYNYKGSIGVYAGSFLNTYLLNNVLRNPETYELYIRGRSPEVFQTYINSDPMFLATRTAYFYNLKGPAINLQTACSTSLVAISQACTSLLGYESDMCVAGGVTVITPQETGYLYQEGAIGSPDGHCRPFDKDSNGTVFGNGVGTVILKRLKDAIDDNDRIYSVIRGWSVNNDGNQKVGFTAPGIEGQSSAIRMAQSFANINPEEINYIEAHGTATPLGDPIEVAALSKAFGNRANKKQYCGIGSVKSNIGHLDAAAGVAGLIKISLAAYHKIIPATLHYKEPNPRIDFKNSPFYVVNKNIEWTEDKPLIMGVSSFGVGGTNAHIVLSNYKVEKKAVKTSRPDLFLLSAKSENAIKQIQLNLTEFLASDKIYSSEDIAYTLQARRMHMPIRSIAVSYNKADVNADSFTTKTYNSSINNLAFVFPGQGAQLPLMGNDLYNTEPVFKDILDQCFNSYLKITGISLKEIIFSENTEKSAKQLAQTRITQPAIFVIEYALAKLYIHYGILPNSLVGHSIGEYTAAAIAGVFDLESAISIVCKRGELMQSMPEGNMIAVFSSSEILKEFAGNLFEIAAINSQSMCTISFQTENNAKVLALLNEKEISFTPLDTSHAFHSNAFDPILNEFSQFVNSFDLKEPSIPFISCLTGKKITNEQAISGEYWSKQLRNSVLFATGIEHLNKNEDVVFLEVGPNTHLSSLIRQNSSIKDKTLIINSLGKTTKESEQIKFYKSIGELWMRGINAQFENLYDNKIPNLVPLPPYPFDKNRYWIDSTPYSTNNSKTELNLNNEDINIPVAEKKNNSVQSRILELLSSESGYEIDKLDLNQNFADMGLDSLFLARYSILIEKEFKCKVEFRKLVFECSNVDKLTKYIESNSNLSKKILVEKTLKNKNSHLQNFTPFKPEGDKPPLVIVHGDNLNVVLPKNLDKKRPYYGYLHLSADGRRNPFSSVHQMANHYVEQLLKNHPEGPFYLGGFSFGGILAFEMALILTKKGIDIPSLFIIDSGTSEARIRFENEKARNSSKSNSKITKEITFLIKKYYYKAYYKSIRLIRNGYFIFLKRLPVNQRRPYVYDVYTNLSRNYKPKGVFNGKTIVFKASEDSSDLKYLGWEKYATNITDSVTLRGNHVSIVMNNDSLEKIQEIIFNNLTD